MTIQICDLPAAAERQLPENEDDASGVGINYADVVLKAMKTTLPDGRKVLAKRRGLEITLKVGDATGKGLLRRLEHGPDVRDILRHALEEAARNAGVTLSFETDKISLVS